MQYSAVVPIVADFIHQVESIKDENRSLLLEEEKAALIDAVKQFEETALNMQSSNLGTAMA